MSNDTELTNEELAILRAHGYEPAGGDRDGDDMIWLMFCRKKDGKIVRSTHAEWRLTIAGFQRPPTEDEAAFGKDAWVYCKQHCYPHQTGWCSVSPRDKVGLGVKTAEEAYEKCRAWEFPL